MHHFDFYPNWRTRFHLRGDGVIGVRKSHEGVMASHMGCTKMHQFWSILVHFGPFWSILVYLILVHHMCDYMTPP